MPSSEHTRTRTPMEALHALVLALFTAEEFRRWLGHGPDADLVPELPGESAPDAAIVDKALGVLARHGRLDPAFFTRMTTARERRSDTIAAVAALWRESERSPGTSLRAASYGPSSNDDCTGNICGDATSTTKHRGPSGLDHPSVPGPIRTAIEVERPSVAAGNGEVSVTPGARSWPSRRIMLQAGALLVGLAAAVSLYGVFGGSREDEDRGSGEYKRCEEIKGTLRPVKPNIMLVLDKSGSMVRGLDATSNITRWDMLYQAVELIVNDYNDLINFGANLFPSTAATRNYDASACVVADTVEIPVAPSNKDVLLNGIPQVGDTSLKGGRPTSSGVIAALNHLKSLDPQMPAAIILVTVGAANCASGTHLPSLFEDYDQNVHTIVKSAWEVDKIPTYVVGIDIRDVSSGNTRDGNADATNTYQRLNGLALEGGRPKDDPNERFYNVFDEAQLKAAFDAIATDALTCLIPIETQPGISKSARVLIGTMDIPKIMNCASEDGWVYERNTMGLITGIRLCGTACEALRVAKAADVEIFCTAI